MSQGGDPPRKTAGRRGDAGRLDRVVAEARQSRESRDAAYRERALRLYPWVCGRCGREFQRENLRELTVHHKDHDHDNNPENGSNWELLCLYCHDNEHQRFAHLITGVDLPAPEAERATHRPFDNLKDLLKR
jgi:hypothetical protein